MNTTLQALWQETRGGDSVRQRLYQVLRQSIIRMVLVLVLVLVLVPGQALSEREIAARDPELAARAMGPHQQEILQSLPELMRRFPEMFDTQQTQSLVAEASQ